MGKLLIGKEDKTNLLQVFLAVFTYDSPVLINIMINIDHTLKTPCLNERASFLE